MGDGCAPGAGAGEKCANGWRLALRGHCYRHANQRQELANSSIIQGWIPRRVVSAYDVVNASYLPTTINIYDIEIRSINNYRKSYDIASFLVSTNISRRCRFGNSKPCKYIRSSYVRRNCIYDNNRVSVNISSYEYR